MSISPTQFPTLQATGYPASDTAHERPPPCQQAALQAIQMASSSLATSQPLTAIAQPTSLAATQAVTAQTLQVQAASQANGTAAAHHTAATAGGGAIATGLSDGPSPATDNNLSIIQIETILAKYTIDNVFATLKLWFTEESMESCFNAAYEKISPALKQSLSILFDYEQGLISHNIMLKDSGKKTDKEAARFIAVMRLPSFAEKLLNEINKDPELVLSNEALQSVEEFSNLYKLINSHPRQWSLAMRSLDLKEQQIAKK